MKLMKRKISKMTHHISSCNINMAGVRQRQHTELSNNNNNYYYYLFITPQQQNSTRTKKAHIQYTKKESNTQK